MNKTTIEWTEYTWNPVTGCDKISAGCRSCYAEQIATRFWGDRKFTDVQMHPERLNEVFDEARKKRGTALVGKRVFVCDVSDIFHEDVTDQFIIDVWKVFVQYPSTTFQILTKRPQRALAWFKDVAPIFFDREKQAKAKARGLNTFLPLPNVWIGVSCEDQKAADERIPLLLQIPAAVRFLSCEPLIGPINLKKVDQNKNFWLPDAADKIEGCPQIHWVIAGGESGHMARPMHPDWVRSLRDQCSAAYVPFFFKQWGKWYPDAFIKNNADIEALSDTGTYNVQLINSKGIHNSRLFCEGVTEPLFRMISSSKSKSGNLLDGKQHLEFPWFDAAPLSPRN